MADGSSKRVACGVFAILLGALGVHEFYMGHTLSGVIRLAVSLLTVGIGASVMSLIGIIEGVIYLTKTDAEFDSVYIAGGKQWF